MRRYAGPSAAEGTALIAVLKTPRDLGIAAREHWYRIPLKKAPKNNFTHIAFYQPACFRPEGKRIACYAEVAGRALRRRLDILPDEPENPAAGQLYLRYSLGPLLRLPKAVLNTSGARVCFGYAPLGRLRRAAELLGVFNVVPVENLAALRGRGTEAPPESGLKGYIFYIILVARSGPGVRNK